MANKQTSSWFFAKLIAIPVFMFAFAFAMVPMYDVLCEITGLSGRTENIDSYQENFTTADDDFVYVDFLAYTSNGFPVYVTPEVQKMRVKPGKIYTVNYIAKNTSDQVVIGQAIPSVAPEKAALHFKKLECFCFNKQTFLPKQEVKMPVRFVVSTDIDNSIVDMSLSYQFFKLDNKGDNNG